MKKITILFGLTALLFLNACKNKNESLEIQVLAPQEFHDATAGNNVQLLDVRTSKEFQEGHVANAINMDVLEESFSSKVEVLDPDKPVYLYCRSGKRSAKASAILNDLGFKEVYDMEGGFLNWESKGLQSQE